MRTVKIFLFFFIFQCGALHSFSQEVPAPFFYDRRGYKVYQIGPVYEKMIAAAKADGSFTAIALSAGVLEGAYYIGICDAHPKKEPRRLDKLRNSPLTLIVDGEAVVVRSDAYYRMRDRDGVRTELIMYWISKELFDELTSAKKIYAEIGLSYNLLASAENLKAMRVLRDRIENEKDAEFFMEIPASPLVPPLMGYYHWDGYYIKAVSRRDREDDNY